MGEISFWRKEEPVLDQRGSVSKGGMWSHQRQWWDSTKFIKALVTGYGGGKAQPVRCPVLMADGTYKKIGDVQIGDILVSPLNGRTQKVIGIYRQGIKPVYRIDFSDSVHTWACGDHLWTVQDDKRSKGIGFKIKTTLEIKQNLKNEDGNDRYTIPIMAPVKYPKKDLPIHPYLLGCLIASGVLGSALKIRTRLKSVISYLKLIMPENTFIDRKGYITELEGSQLSFYLNKYKLLNNRKRIEIPHDYLTAEFEQRTQLLQGLMDISGQLINVNEAVMFRARTLPLVESFKLLINQLGGLCFKINIKQDIETGLEYYDIYFNLVKFVKAFGKHDMAVAFYEDCRSSCKRPIRYIRNITPTGPEECVCIKVDNEEGLYVTNDGIVTHNTLIGCKRAIAVSLHNSGSPYMWVSPSYKVAKKTAIPTLISLLDGKRTLLKNFDYSYNKTDGEFNIKYGKRTGKIWVASGDMPETLKGPNLCAANIDEPFIQSREVFDQMLARIRDPNAIHKELTLTGTPEELNWGYDICEGEEKDNFDIEVIQASTRANRAIETAYADRLSRSYSDEASQSYVEGKFVSLSKGRVYYGFTDANIVALPGNPNDTYVVGMDFNVNPMAAVVLRIFGNHVHVISCIELPNSDTESMCITLQQKYPGKIAVIVPDASGNKRSTASPGARSDFYYIDEAARLFGGFQRMHKHENPKKKDRYNAVNGKFKPRTGAPSLTIEPCQENKVLIKYLKQYAHEKLHLAEQKAMSHLLDALGYPIAYFFPIIQGYDSVKVIGA